MGIFFLPVWFTFQLFYGKIVLDWRVIDFISHSA